jgi:hypothetical protein
MTLTSSIRGEKLVEVSSAALETVIIGDLPKLKHRRWRWYRCIPLVLLILASKRLGLQQFGFHWLTTASSLVAGLLKSFDYYFSSFQDWLEGPDKILELVAAYSIIFISLFFMTIAVVSYLLTGDPV